MTEHDFIITIRPLKPLNDTSKYIQQVQVFSPDGWTIGVCHIDNFYDTSNLDIYNLLNAGKTARVKLLILDTMEADHD